MGSITNLVLSPDEAVTVADGSTLVPLRLPWYRSLPLSAVEHLTIRVDGESFADGDLSLTLNAAERPFGELAAQSYEFWFVQDTAWVRVPATPVGPSVELGVELALRIPYLMIGPDRALVRHVAEDGTLPVAGVN